LGYANPEHLQTIGVPGEGQYKNLLSLAEDKIVHQRVALRLLEELGYRADVAVDVQ
jgi:hypothetical protein